MRYFIRAVKLLWPLRGRLAIYFVCATIYGAVNSAPLALGRALLGLLQDPEAGAEGFKDPVGKTVYQTFMYLAGPGEALIVGLCLGIIVLLALAAVFDFLQSYLNSWITQRLTTDAVIQLMHHLLQMDMAFYDKRKMGDIVSRVTINTQALGSTAKLTLNVIKQPPMVFFLAAFALYLNWKLFLIAFAAFALAIYPILAITRRIYKAAYKARAGYGEISQSVLENLYGLRTVQAYEAVEAEKANFTEKCDRFFRYLMKQRRGRALQGPLAHVILGSGIVIVLLIGSLQVLRGYTTLEDFMIFLGALAAMYTPTRGMITTIGELAEFVPMAEATFEFMDLKSAIGERPEARACPALQKEIVFENVTFDYGREPVLDRLNLTIRKGEKIGIVGRTGVGKSTLLSLLLRFYDPKGGRILIDGADIRECTIHSLRRQIALVTQDPFLFHASIEDNIRYGRPGASKEEIVAAAKAAAIHDEITRFPQAYATLAGDRGATISGGQRQRIAVARALLRNAPILLLDEATSSLDSASEKLVQEALDYLAEGRTSLVVAHRLSTVRDADRILVFADDGQIEALAPHDELIESSPTYRKLWQRQTGAVLPEPLRK